MCIVKEQADLFTFCLLRIVQFFQRSSRTWLLVPMTAALHPHRGHIQVTYLDKTMKVKTLMHI